MFGFIGKIFGTSNDRNLKRMQKFVDAINSFDEDYISKEDSFYRELKLDLSQKFSQNNDLYSILPEAFAAVREAGKRTIGLRHLYEYQVNCTQNKETVKKIDWRSAIRGERNWPLHNWWKK